LATGGTPSKAKPEYFGGDIKWLVSGDIHQQEIFDCEGRITVAGMKNSNAKFLPINSVMIALNGQGKTRGTVGLLRTQATCNQSLVSICPKNSGVLMPEFLYVYLHGCYQEIRRMTGDSGNDRRGLNMGLISSIEIPIPPLPDQQRIVGILDEAFDGIATAKANAEKNLQNARALFESHLQSVFTQSADGWVEKPLGDLCKKITKGSSPKWQGIDYVDKPGILFVTSENVGEYRLLMEKPKYVEEKFNEKDKKSILQNGDVLTNIVGASIGRTAIFDLDEVANINQAVCLMRCEPTLLNNYYLSYLLNSPVFRQVLHGNEVDNARANLSLGFFSKLPVPLPSLQVQKDIVTKLNYFHSETQHLESIYQQKLSALDALKKSLLDQAFSGEL